MKRNPGSVVDTAGRRTRERDGHWYPLDRLVVAGDALYFGRPLDSSPLFTYYERWLLPAHGLVITRFALAPGAPTSVDWYIETDLIEVEGSLWRVRDCYLDVAVYEGVRYELWDADELAAGLRAREIPLAEALTALESLHRLCQALAEHDFSGRALLRAIAPGLPCDPPASGRVDADAPLAEGHHDEAARSPGHRRS